MINYKLTPIQSPSVKEKMALRLMILIGVVSVIFFLYTLLQPGNISYYPLYVLLIITMVYYCFKYLHEWYHYFSITSPVTPAAAKMYTVDILTTYCPGEPFDMLERTLTAIQNITYPHTAWCCDEADDPNVKQLCFRLGIQHVTRTDKTDAKAGNINNALQYATGDLCVVLDPDHIPAPEFLDQVVAYFDNPSIGFVQVVQAYYNQQQSLVAKGAAQQTYQFYGPMMMAMQSYGTVQAIGANCTFRRAALDSIGGHANGLAEDMHTAMQLHAKGWQSVYVPAIITRGLVPATMSSYYKQQLKWSRGTWELLLVTYPALFKQFTWRQKIHYFTLPFHYLLGFIFFINFLIPVISLFTGYIPLQMDVLNFLLASAPLFTMSILIRHYVQKWVAEDSDRGFHFIGGILQIGAWWVYSIGFIYTIFRKKVPYIPTPKNDHDPLPFLFSLPNIVIAIVSLAAIAYGIRFDYNPYTVFMVVLASMQVIFMVFIFFISGYTSETSAASDFAMKLRQHTWLIKKAHGFLRTYSLPLAMVLIVAFVFAYRQQQKLPDFLPPPPPGLQIFYKGFSLQSNAENNVASGNFFASLLTKQQTAIIAANVPWGAGEKNILDTSYLNQVYHHHALPLLVWQLWQKDSGIAVAQDSMVLQQITDGEYDEVITAFAKQLATLNKPVFLTFGDEAVRDKYPLFSATGNNPQLYIAAWQYVHQLVSKAGADKVVWVWTPKDVLSATAYFPGKGFTDWINIHITDSTGRPVTSFDQLYRPYHQQPVFNSGLPVMITGANVSNRYNLQWWNAAWQNVDTAFKEIKSVLADYPAHKEGTVHNAGDVTMQNTLWQNAPAASMPPDATYSKSRITTGVTKNHQLPGGIKCVEYNKGYYWFRNRHTLNLRTLQADVAAMKKVGINTVQRMMPGFYDNNLGKVLAENNIRLIPCFRIPATMAVMNDKKLLQKEKNNILNVIKNNLQNKNIIAWNVGDDVLSSLASQTFLPDYFFYRQRYTEWLSELCRQIRLTDSTRPIVMNLNWDENGRERFHYYEGQVPEINTYMLTAVAKYPAGLAEPLEPGMTWGKVAPELWPLLPAIRQSGTLPAWQDLENTRYISLDGLLDMEGRKKQWYNTVASTWNNTPGKPSPIPEISILKPAKLAFEGNELIYQVIVKYNHQWKLYHNNVPGLSFEWNLVRTDQYGNTLFIKKAGEGPSLDFVIPREPQYYKLTLEAIMGDQVKVLSTTLNTPLYYE
ncbi:glycosyltransferase [Ferruginibacter paludis]|uniref:glycosyltransferase n=1 Tax=Ferruginibacter paludis TaxID=1310417 RepID=UPI0025B52F44|nr:glycosyltransferase [Ferruginibacter paludis]MDN3654620.1 glycosyltransferase [Ferruginibacter paludis]